MSYQLNKRFTFKNSKVNSKTPFKFILYIATSYLIGYGIAKPLTRAILTGLSQETNENIAMLVGSILYVGLSYLGQRLYKFKNDERK